MKVIRIRGELQSGSRYWYLHASSPALYFKLPCCLFQEMLWGCLFCLLFTAMPTPDLRACVCVCVCLFAQLPLTLCDPLDCSLLGSPVRAIFQARTLDFVAICYSRACCGPRGQTHTSCISCIGRWILYHCATWEAPRFGYFCFSFYWSIIVLKSCVHFYCTAKWISYTYTHISLLLWISLPFRSPQSTEQSILCYTVGSHWLSILYILYAFYIQCI